MGLIRGFKSELGTKLDNLAQIWTCTPLIRPIIHQRVMLEGPESLKNPNELLLPENVLISAFYTYNHSV